MHRQRNCSNNPSKKVPDRSVYQYHLGLSYYKMGDRDKARSALGQALKLDPAFSGAQDAKNILASLGSS